MSEVYTSGPETVINIMIPYGESRMANAFELALEDAVKKLNVIVEGQMKVAAEKWAEERLTQEMGKMDMKGLSSLIAICTARQIAKAVEGKTEN